MRLSFYAVALASILIGEQKVIAASSFENQVISFLKAYAEQEPVVHAEIESEAETSVDLDCMAALATDCDAGMENACEAMEAKSACQKAKPANSGNSVMPPELAAVKNMLIKEV